MTTGEILTVAGFMITISLAMVKSFFSLNIRITENATDILNIKKEIDEHKVSNKDSFVEIKEILRENRNDNKQEHNKMNELLINKFSQGL